ncbi:hypothetical protein CYMTET_43577 [Cymbomonas tetramitiformis]|uniref:Uncharacterized protein n=1 Tax=Cymbomonas tetramitiformis TaxID=36881 RepID=A0AAE0EZU3_9CHLO|nr:hypothetical protein CYMTET_43577 [Cymbomonas tetramitiformis]
MEHDEHDDIDPEYHTFLQEHQDIDLEYLALGVELREFDAGSCLRRATAVQARTRCPVWQTGYATKPKTVAQKKTPEHIAILEKYYLDGLLIGPGRSCRAPNRDLLAAVNNASAYDKQLRLEQVTSWFSQRYSKQQSAIQNRAVNNTVDVVVATHGVGVEGGSGAVDATGAASTVATVAVVPQTVPQTPSLGKRALAASAKRLALMDLSLVALEKSRACEDIQSQESLVKKLKLDSLQGLLLALHDDASYSLPVARKEGHLQSVLAFLPIIPLLGAHALAASESEVAMETEAQAHHANHNSGDQHFGDATRQQPVMREDDDRVALELLGRILAQFSSS